MVSENGFHLSSSGGGVQPKYKLRRVSAVRNFPPGCGRNAPKINLKPEEKSSVLAETNAEGDGVGTSETKVDSRSVEVAQSPTGPETDESLVNKVIGSAGLVNRVEAEELNLEGKSPGVELTKGLENGAMEELKVLPERDHQVLVEECNEVQGLAVGRNEGGKENRILMESGAVADGVAPGGNLKSFSPSQLQISDPGITEKKTSSLKDKYQRRRVSATRDFPPFCGRNAPMLTEADRLRISGNGSLHGNSKKFELSEIVPEPRRSLTVTEEENKDVTCLAGTIAKSKNKSLKRRPSDDVTDLGGVVERVMVQDEMATPSCPWRQGKGGLSSLDGEMIDRKIKKPDFIRRRKAKLVGKAADGSTRAIVRNNNHAVCNREQHEDILVGWTVDDFDASLPPCSPSSLSRGNARNRVRETLNLFRTICRKLLQGEEHKLIEGEESRPKQQGGRIDLLAAKIVKKEGKEVKTGKQIVGAVPGVEVGDRFQYRVELALVGVHRLYQAGIDYMKHDGKVIATSIVSSGAYADDTEKADILIYSGEGGNIVGKNKLPEDQKLERGNLALKNSISVRNPVRVIRGTKATKTSGSFDARAKMAMSYCYDGIYTVEKYWTEMGPHGKLVFMFELRRIPGQQQE